MRALCAMLLALWVPLAPAGQATCLAARTAPLPEAASKPRLRCHGGGDTGKHAGDKATCCCKKVPTISSRNCGCHHGDTGWPVLRDQAMPARCDALGAPLPSMSPHLAAADTMRPRSGEPPELPPPESFALA